MEMSSLCQGFHVLFYKILGSDYDNIDPDLQTLD